MLKVLFSCCFICFGFQSWSQIQADANTLFDNYEYESAAKAFEMKQGKLNLEEKEKLAFCYFRTDDFTKGLPLIQTLLKKDSTSGDYWFWKANLEKEKGDYSKAAISFIKVKAYDNSYDVDVLIASCEAIPKWTSIPRSASSLHPNNDSWANNYTIINSQYYHYYENGKDSASNDLNISSKSNSFTELFLMKAFASKSEGASALFVDSKLTSYSLSSVSKIAPNGQLYFSANDPIAQDNLSHIYAANLDGNGKISNAQILNTLDGMNDSSAFAHPAITSDGKTLIFTKMGYHTQGSDLYVAYKNNTEQWSVPKPLSFLNTKMDEMFPKIIGDSILIFSSDGRVGYGHLDMYSIALSNIETGASLTHLKAPINSSGDDFNLEWTSDTTAFFVSNRKGGVGDDDVYQLLVKKEIPPKPVVLIDTAYQNWLTKWNNRKWYFDFDKWESEITSEFMTSLIAYVEKYDLKINITGHTDAKGSDEYNQKLGQQRAKWFASKLNAAGISQNRITSISVGESELVNDCDNDKNCDDEQHRLNRFVLITIISGSSTKNSTQVRI